MASFYLAAVVALVAASASTLATPATAGFDLRVQISDVHLGFIDTADPASAAEAKILIEEGCLAPGGPPLRKLLKFSTTIRNDGDEDLKIGLPPHNRTLRTARWEWGLSHAHWHYRNYAHYELLSKTSRVGSSRPAALGMKTGFCVMDTKCNRPGVEPKYECCNMGVTAGCQDTYGSSLPCQWIDVTSLDTSADNEEEYTLVVKVNPDNLLGEGNMANNVARVKVSFEDLHEDGLVRPSPEPLESPAPMPYSDRWPKCKAWIDKDDTVNPDAPIARVDL